MARINSVDPRAPTLSPSAVRVVGGQLIEADGTAPGTYVLDVIIPAYAVILDVLIHSEELWTADTSAKLDVGLYESSGGTIGSVIDADEIWVDVNLKATDLTKGQSLNFNFDSQGGIPGGMLSEGSNTHNLDVVADDERQIRFSVLTVGTVGTAGETYVYVVYAVPEMDTATFTAT